jgi:hypothetical protein
LLVDAYASKKGDERIRMILFAWWLCVAL